MKWYVLLCVIWAQMSNATSVTGDVVVMAAIKEKLDKIVAHSGLKKADIGAYVTDLSKNTYFDFNGDKRFIPASITKLITSAAVLNAFGPNYKFHTQIYVDGEQTGSTLKGNIYLKGGGDPAFVSEKMWMLVNDFTRTGIKKITGNIIVDESAFDSERFDPGREADRNDRAYDAPIGALSFNWNSATIYVRPGAKAGDKAAVWVDPDNDYVTLKSDVVTSKSGTDVSANRTTTNGRDTLSVEGKISLSADEHHIYKNITSPPLYAAYNFRNFLKQRAIEVVGTNYGVAPVPSSARLAADEEGWPLTQIVTDMNKFSNNFVAEMLTKNLAASKTGHQGKMSDGLDQVRQFLIKDLGFDPASFNLANVSGFTRKNSFTPHQFTQILAWSEKQFKIFPEYLQSLPVAGIDGTLHNRMKNAAGEGAVRAKTGLLNGVVALAGFAGRQEGTLLFAFIYNGHGDEGHVREVFDSMASSLVK